MTTQHKTKLNDLQFLVARKAISYGRVSTDDQADYGTSLKSQKKAIERYAQDNDIDIIAHFEDDYSGRKLDRPKFSKVREYLKDGLANCLIVYKGDRLSRHRTHTLMIADELQELGVELHLVTKGQVDLNDNISVMMLSIEGHLSHNEVDTITERMTRGRREKTKEGQIMVRIPPYGYEIQRDVEETEHGRLVVTNRTLVPNPLETHLVKLIFELYATGDFSFYRLAKHLNEQGYTYRNGTEWNYVYVRRLLHSRTYLGEYSYSGIDISIPAIVSPDVWQAAQEAIKHNRKARRKQSKRRYLFSQRVTCYHCKNAMTGARGYYRCGAATRYLDQFYKKLCTVNKYFPEKKLDVVVFDWLHKVLTDRKVLRQGWEDYKTEQTKNHQPLLDELTRVEKIIDRSQKKLDRLLDVYLDEGIDKETFQHRKDYLQQEIKSAKMTKTDLDSKLAVIAKLPQQLKAIEELELISEQAFQTGIPDKYKPDLIRELDVKLELEWDGQEMWVHITCIVGKGDKPLIETPIDFVV